MVILGSLTSSFRIGTAKVALFSKPPNFFAKNLHILLLRLQTGAECEDGFPAKPGMTVEEQLLESHTELQTKVVESLDVETVVSVCRIAVVCC